MVVLDVYNLDSFRSCSRPDNQSPPSGQPNGVVIATRSAKPMQAQCTVAEEERPTADSADPGQPFTVAPTNLYPPELNRPTRIRERALQSPRSELKLQRATSQADASQPCQSCLIRIAVPVCRHEADCIPTERRCWPYPGITSPAPPGRTTPASPPASDRAERSDSSRIASPSHVRDHRLPSAQPPFATPC